MAKKTWTNWEAHWNKIMNHRSWFSSTNCYYWRELIIHLIFCKPGEEIIHGFIFQSVASQCCCFHEKWGGHLFYTRGHQNLNWSTKKDGSHLSYDDTFHKHFSFCYNERSKVYIPYLTSEICCYYMVVLFRTETSTEIRKNNSNNNNKN